MGFVKKPLKELIPILKLNPSVVFNDPCGYYGRIPSSKMPLM
jgi:hypothetical protein